MKKIIGVLFLLVTGSWFVSCGVEGIVSNASAGQFDPDQCKNQRGNAVLIQLDNQDQQPHISEVNFSYSLNGEKWVNLENDGSNSFRIVNTGGHYRIKAQKKGYYLESALVIVPYERNCRILEQTVTFTMRPSQPPCPAETQITLNISEPKPSDNLEFVVTFPGGERTWRQCDGNDCILNLTLTNSGMYEINFSGFPTNKISNPLTSQITYNYETVKFLIDDGERRQQIVSEGIETLSLKIPYNLGPSGCPEIAYDNISVNETHVFSQDSNLVEIHEKTALSIKESNSSQCLMQLKDFDLHFDIYLPSGTLPGSYSIEYWFENQWEPATCNTNNGGISCIAKITNPFHSDKYQVRAMINNQEYIAAYIPLWNKCVYFE